MHLELSNASFSMAKQLFLKFYPSDLKLADEFAKSLPEGKISMAKLQGHFLQYRDDPQEAIDNHTELTKEVKSAADMSIAEWLDRLNLYEYYAMFTKNQAYLVSELKQHLHIHDKTRFNDKFVFEDKLKERRIKFMITGSDEDRAQFNYLTPSQARRMIQRFVKKPKIVNKLVAAIPENTMTAF